MNDYFIGVRTLEDKLAELLAEKSLLHTTNTSSYPITLTVTQNQAPDAQMAIWTNSDGSTSSQDSVLRFIFYLDGMEIQTNSRLVMSDTLMSKIKGLAKKIHAAYVHAYFADTVATVRPAVCDDADGDTEDTGDFEGFYDDDDDLEDTPDDVADIDDTEDDE